MHDYVSPYPTYDKILELFMSNPHHRLEDSYIIQQFDIREQNGIRSALASLESEECIKKDSHSGNWYILLANGSSIYNSGGYRGRLDRERIAYDFKNQLDAANLSMSKSVEITNKAIQDNLSFQKKFGNRSLLIGAISAIFILATIILSITDNSKRKLDDIKTELSNIKISIDSNRISLEKINTFLKKSTTDTLLLKKR